MTELNMCDLQCPKKMMMALKYRADMAGQSNPIGRFITSVGLGLRGVGQMARATATCSSRNLPKGQWSASPECLAEAQRTADGMPWVVRSTLTASESTTLAKIRLKDDPPLDNASTNEPTIEELATKALAADVIDQEFAGHLRGSADLEEALGMFYTYVIEKGDDPEALLAEWGITK
jgi:hypothetical protein